MPKIIITPEGRFDQLFEQPLMLSLAPGELDIQAFDAEVNRISGGSRIDPLKFIVIKDNGALEAPLLMLSSNHNYHVEMLAEARKIYPGANAVCAGLYFRRSFGDYSTTLAKTMELTIEASTEYMQNQLAPILEGTGLSVSL